MPNRIGFHVGSLAPGSLSMWSNSWDGQPDESCSSMFLSTSACIRLEIAASPRVGSRSETGKMTAESVQVRRRGGMRLWSMGVGVSLVLGGAAVQAQHRPGRRPQGRSPVAQPQDPPPAGPSTESSVGPTSPSAVDPPAGRHRAPRQPRHRTHRSCPCRLRRPRQPTHRLWRCLPRSSHRCRRRPAARSACRASSATRWGAVERRTGNWRATSRSEQRRDPLGAGHADRS